MDTTIAHNDLDVAQLFERLCPAPDAANGRVAVSGEASLGHVETATSPVVGDENQPEPVRAGFERWTVGVFASEDAVGQLGVGFNLSGSSGSFGSHGESFPPAARWKFGAQSP